MHEHETSVQDLDFVEMPRDAVACAKASQEVKGYQIQTDLDRKLLLGIWELDRKDASVELYSDLSSQNVPSVPNVNVN